MCKYKQRFLVLWIAIGALIVLGALFILKSPVFGMAIGFAGGMVGTAMIYLFLSRKEDPGEYEKRMARIRKDERNIMLRDKSGRYAYIAGMVLLIIITTTFFVLKNMGVPIHMDLVITVYSTLVLFEYALGMLVFSYLERKY